MARLLCIRCVHVCVLLYYAECWGAMHSDVKEWEFSCSMQKQHIESQRYMWHKGHMGFCY